MACAEAQDLLLLPLNGFTECASERRDHRALRSSTNHRIQKPTMPELLRRRNHASQQECWHVYYRDIHVGTITAQTGLPNALDQWSWSCGFYPLTHRGLNITGTSANLFQAWAAFEDAWEEYLPLCNERVFTEHRRKRVWTAWKQRMWNAGCRMPTQNDDGRSHCFCGVEIDVIDLERHVYAAHMVSCNDVRV